MCTRLSSGSDATKYVPEDDEEEEDEEEDCWVGSVALSSSWQREFNMRIDYSDKAREEG